VKSETGRPTFAEIDLTALKSNFGVIRSSLPAGTEILAVVKANAYGHGTEIISQELVGLGVDAFGVAFLGEGIQLRMRGIDKPILLLGGVYPGQERQCIGLNISTTVFCIDQARALDRAAASLARKARAQIHLKIDTGMGRLGIPYADVPAFLEELRKLSNITLEGLISHFSSADELDENGRSYTALQEERFRQGLSETRAAGFTPRYIHIANSAGALLGACPDCNLVRPGIALYGVLPSPDFRDRMELRPVMSVKSRVAMLKWVDPGTSISYARRFTTATRTLIASVPVGYADGFPRSLTNKGEALIRSQRARVCGTVCMDWIMLDVTGIEGVSVGDEVVLMGSDRRGNAILAEELAEAAGTIPYEILCGFSQRMPLVYVR
jgi:alanine racemase